MHLLGEPFPPTWRGRPPAMLDADVPVWHAFLDQRGAEFTRFFYNVRITSEDLAARFPRAEDRSIAEALLPKRIDAVGERGADIWLIEVAETPGLRSLGQLLTYRTLWAREHPDQAARLRMVLLARTCPADERLAARAAGIELICLAD